MRGPTFWIELPILFHDSGLITCSELAIEPFQIILNELSLKRLNLSESSSDNERKFIVKRCQKNQVTANNGKQSDQNIIHSWQDLHLQLSAAESLTVLKALSSLTLVTLLSSWSAAHAREVRVYSGRHYNSDRQVFKDFKQKTGIKVRLVEASGISLVERLKREGSNSNADVILLVDAARINNAAKANLLQSIDGSAILNNIPERYKDPSNRWFRPTRRVRSIIVNPKKVNPQSIQTYADLAKPELTGQLCLRKRNNVYNQSLVANQIILQGEGFATKWVEGMIGNVSQPFYSGDVSLIRAVGQGKCGVSIINHYYFARMKDGSSGSKDQQLTDNVQVIIQNQPMSTSALQD